jgi:hypothetical protein
LEKFPKALLLFFSRFSHKIISNFIKAFKNVSSTKMEDVNVISHHPIFTLKIVSAIAHFVLALK